MDSERLGLLRRRARRGAVWDGGGSLSARGGGGWLTLSVTDLSTQGSVTRNRGSADVLTARGGEGGGCLRPTAATTSATEAAAAAAPLLDGLRATRTRPRKSKVVKGPQGRLPAPEAKGEPGPVCRHRCNAAPEAKGEACLQHRYLPPAGPQTRLPPAGPAGPEGRIAPRARGPHHLGRRATLPAVERAVGGRTVPHEGQELPRDFQEILPRRGRVTSDGRRWRKPLSFSWSSLAETHVSGPHISPCRHRPCRHRPCRHRPCRHSPCRHSPCRHTVAAAVARDKGGASPSRPREHIPRADTWEGTTLQCPWPWSFAIKCRARLMCT